MRPQARTPRRGQATIELAIGALLLVAVVLLGLHMSEVAFLSLKTTEAAALGIWESSGRRVHHFGRDEQAAGGDRYYAALNQELLPSAGPLAQGRYANFDGRSSAVNGGGALTQVLTQAERMLVTCVDDNSVDFTMQMSGNEATEHDDPYLPEVRQRLRQLYPARVGGMRCSARAGLSMERAPRRFLDGPEQGGFFKERLWEMERLQVCGAGRAVGTSCRGSFAILLGDWSLDGPRDSEIMESTMHWDAATGNRRQPYRWLVQSLYDANGGSRGRAASRFAREVGNEQRSPHDESQFYMSYAGIEWDYEDWDYVNLDQYRRDKEIFNTAGVSDTYGGYPRPAFRPPPPNRAPCYLGMRPCN